MPLPRPLSIPKSIGLSLMLTLLVPLTAFAQFGRNKVQYAEFDFKVLETPHFDIYYYSSEANAAAEVARMAERWHTRLGNVLSHELTGRQAVVLYASHPEFEQTNVIEGAIDESTGGVTEGQRRRVVLPLGATLRETDHVLGHELVHAYQYDILGRNAGAVPLWFIEGMAEYLSLGPRYPQTAMWMRDAVLEGILPTLDQLDNPVFFPYRFGHAFWAYIGGRYGDRTIGEILKSISMPGGGALDPVEVIETSLSLKQDAISAEWHQSIRTLYNVTPLERPFDDKERPFEPGEAVSISQRSGSGSLNVGPALSPDGTKIAFLSGRGGLAIDLYVADTATAKITQTLTKTAVDPHFQSLQFLQSAGAWSPDSKRLAVATVRDGRGRISVFDVAAKRVEREIPMESRGEIFQPAWSPDGTKLAYSAQIGGVTDLFVYEFATSTTKQLTNDAFADLQPTWSPDGRRLIFTTERMTSDMKTLSFGGYRLAMLDLSTGAITAVETGLSGNVVNPQWSGDGRSLYFISDTTGRPDVYRADANGGQPQIVASVTTGISGITPLSPALSIAANSSRAAYNVFRNSGYEIHFLDLTGSTPAPVVAGPATDLGLLAVPSADRPSVVAEVLQSPAPPASETEPYETKKYSPKLSLVGAGQYLGASTGGMYGTYVSGGISLLFSDVLGNHLIGTSFSVEGNAKDFAADVTYLNRTNRWNWGIFAQRVPLVSGSVSAGTTVSNGRLLYVETTSLYRQNYLSTGGILAYPLSRVTRVETTAGFTNITFDYEVQTRAFDYNTGNQVIDETTNVEAGEPLRMFETSAALVRDTSTFGPTSPILGQRFRLEAAPTFGDLEYVTTTADFRQYYMPVRPLVLAGRALHVGRYGASSEDIRLSPLFVGYPSLVRGYDPYSFNASECTVTVTGGCPELDDMEGSRMMVINAEARMPLFGFRGGLSYGPIPAEVFGFFDAGVAWTQATRPRFFSSGDRNWVKSAGVGARVNAMGFLILEFNMAKAIDRPEQGWMFVFNMRPGF